MHAYAWAWQQSATGDSEKLVLLAMCEFADPTGLCWPSHATLARMTGRSRITVIRALEGLVANGLVFRLVGKGKSNTYRLNLIGPQLPAEVPDHIDAARSVRMGRQLEMAVAMSSGVSHADTPSLSTGVASERDTQVSHADTPPCDTVIQGVSRLSDTGGVASGRDTNRNEPSRTISDTSDPNWHVIPEPAKELAYDSLAKIRREMAARKAGVDPETGEVIR